MTTRWRVIGSFADDSGRIWLDEEYDIEAPARELYRLTTRRDCADLVEERAMACHTPDLTLERLEYDDEDEVTGNQVVDHKILED